MCYTGQNQEDSIIINRAALGRGMFRSVKFQCFKDVEHQNGGTDAERFENVDELHNVVGKTTANYGKLNSGGMAVVGSSVQPNDVVISKTITTTEVGEGTRRTVKRDNSTILRHDRGVVDAVLRVNNSDGTHMARVRVRDTRTPVVGDKFSSRMGQKGVIGAALPHEDMPYTAEGLTPDIIMNPHAVPSRMTIGQILETLEGILCSITGKRGDGTMFRGASARARSATQLEERPATTAHGRVDAATTGSPAGGLRGPRSSSGPPTTSACDTWPPTSTTRGRGGRCTRSSAASPPRARARDGGLRFGEMETRLPHRAAARPR